MIAYMGKDSATQMFITVLFKIVMGGAPEWLSGAPEWLSR